MDISYLHWAKAEAYSYFLDVKRRYNELLNDEPSPDRNYHLWQLQSLLTFAELRWKSIYIPPLADQFVHRVVTSEAKQKEDACTEELVSEHSEDTPNSVSVATTDSILDSDPISGSKTDSDKGLNGISKSTSTIEEPAISMGDFTISTSEEIQSIPTSVVEEGDSLDSVDEADDSSNLPLIPPFFFVENDADDSTEAVSFQFTVTDKTEVNNVARKYQIKWGKRFSFILDSPRITFDPGKNINLIQRFCYLAGVPEFGFAIISSILMGECNGMSVYELLSKNGYWADSWSGDSIICRLTDGGVFSTAEMLFVQMLKRDTNWFDGTLATVSRSWYDSVVCVYLRFVHIRALFDRGKAIELIMGCQLDFCPIPLIVKLCINEAAIWDERKMLDKMSENVKLSGVGVESFLQLTMSKVFDRGKESYGITEFSNSLDAYECGSITFPSCVMFPRLGYPIEFQFLNSLILIISYDAKSGGEWNLDAEISESNKLLFRLLARVGSFNSAQKWYVHVLGMKGGEIFFLLLTCKLLEVIQIGIYKCQNSPPCSSYMVKMTMLSSILDSDHGGVYFYIYFVYTCSVFDRGKKFEDISWFSYIADGIFWKLQLGIHNATGVLSGELLKGGTMAHWHGKVLSLPWIYYVFTTLAVVSFINTSDLSVLAMCSLLLAKYNGNSTHEIIFENGAIYKLLPKRVQSSVLWSKLILKVIGNNEAGAVKDLFDHIHHSKWRFCDSLILQLGNGSQSPLKIYVVARQYAGESQRLSKGITCKFVFLSLRASKLCDVSLQQGIEFYSLHLSLWNITSGDVFTLFFTVLHKGPSSTVCSSNECCCGGAKFLVVEIKVFLVLINGSVCSYGYLKWKFRLFQPGIWSLRSVTTQVKFSVFNLNANWTAHSKSFWVVSVYIEVLWSSNEEYIREHGFPNASEWLRGSAGTHRNERSAMTSFLCCNRVLLLKSIQFRLMVFPALTVRMFGLFLRWKPAASDGIDLHHVLISIPSQVGAVNESAPALHLTAAATFMFLIVFNYVQRLQTEVFKHPKVYCSITSICAILSQIFEATELRNPRNRLQHFLLYEFKSVAANGTSIGAYSAGSHDSKGPVYLEKMKTQASTLLVHLEGVILNLETCRSTKRAWAAGLSCTRYGLLYKCLWAPHCRFWSSAA